MEDGSEVCGRGVVVVVIQAENGLYVRFMEDGSDVRRRGMVVVVIQAENGLYILLVTIVCMAKGACPNDSS